MDHHFSGHFHQLTSFLNRNVSPLTIENMEKNGATAHREPLSPDTTKGNVGSQTDVNDRAPSKLSSQDKSRHEPSPAGLLPILEDLLLPEASLAGSSETQTVDKQTKVDQVIKTPADGKFKIRAEGLGEDPGNALREATNKLQSLGLDNNKEDELADDRAATPKPTQTKAVSASAGVESFPKSPSIDYFDKFAVVSSPLQGPSQLPSMPSTRRTSNAGSVSVHGHAAAARMPALRRMSTADSMLSGPSRTPLSRETSNMMSSAEDATVYSDATRMRFNEDDRLLEQFVNQNEPASFVEQPADEIPTEVEEKLKHGSYSFACSFGWEGKEKEDLEETPLSRESYIEKLEDAKDGIRFVVRAMINYQSEINSRNHHKFKPQFLSHQNQACIVTLTQLDEIEVHLNDVIKEIHSLSEDDAELEKQLARAYTDAIPWVKRTQRLVCEAHIFYKLNYVLGRSQKTTKPKSALPTIPAGEAVPNSSVGSKTNSQGSELTSCSWSASRLE